MMRRGRLQILTVALGMSVTAALSAGQAERPLRTEIQALADEYGFAVRGFDKLGSEQVRRVMGDLRDRLAALLADYNHVLVGTPPELSRVIVVSVKDRTPREIVVKTTRRGSHHLVDATVEGAGGRRSTVALMVDTGASHVVLPSSMIETLGFRRERLRDKTSRTANGPVTGKFTRLTTLRVASAVARDVDVLFLPDDRLGGNMLLGMSFLQRFGLTIDDGRSRLLLTPK